MFQPGKELKDWWKELAYTSDKSTQTMHASQDGRDSKLDIPVLTLRSGTWNLWLTERLFCLLVTLFKTSHVCWQVFSPGALMSQYSLVSVWAIPETEHGFMTEEHIWIAFLTVSFSVMNRLQHQIWFMKWYSKKKKKKKKRVRSTKGWQNKNRSFTQEQIIWPLHRSLTGRWDQGSKFNRELKNKLPIRVPQWKPLTKYYKVQLDISPSSFLPPQKTYFYCQVLRINLLGHIFHHVMLWPGSKQVLGWTWNTSSSFPCFPRNRIPFFSWTAHSQVDNI